MIIKDNSLGNLIAWLIVGGGWLCVMRFLVNAWEELQKARKGNRR